MVGQADLPMSLMRPDSTQSFLRPTIPTGMGSLRVAPEPSEHLYFHIMILLAINIYGLEDLL